MQCERTYIVGDDEDGIRLDVLMGTVGGFPSRSSAVRAIETGLVLVDGEQRSKRYIVSEGERVVYEPYEEMVPTLMPRYIPLDIRYEDDYLLVISKQTDLVCHPSIGHEDDTLANALVAHCGAEHLGMLQGADRPGIVHRLDKDTSGLMLAAKDDRTQEALQDGIRIRSIDRRYLTLVHGYIAPDTGLIDAPITRGGADRKRMVVSDEPGARSSVTTFSVLERFEAGRFDDGYTLLECKLYTGRTHQIRVHMDYINHPCVGDQLYGAVRSKADRGLTRQFLHSYRLEFVHPMTGEELSFIDQLPDDLRSVLGDIADRSMGRTVRGDEVVSELTAQEDGAE